MALSTEFNPEAARALVTQLINKTPGEIEAVFSAIGTPTQKSIDALEDAFVKDLKRETMYADLYDALAVRVEKNKDNPDFIAKTVADFRAGGIAGIVQPKVAVYAALAKLKPGLHPVLKTFAEEGARLTDIDYAEVTKPLRLMTAALKKINQPLAAPAPRKFVGQK